MLAASGMAHARAADMAAHGAAAALGAALDAVVGRGMGRVSVHLDVDVLDAAWAPANRFAPEGGLLPDQFAACVGEIMRRFAIAAAGVASHDPDHDREDRVLGTALDFLRFVRRPAAPAPVARRPDAAPTRAAGMTTAPPDRVHLARDGASGVEAVQARFAGHAYDPHRHDEWLVGVTDRGVQDFACRGARRRSTPGRVILIEPEEPHDGRAGGAEGFAYRMLYLPRPWLRVGLADAPGGAPAFPANLRDDPPLAAAIRAACDAVLRPDARLVRDAALDEVLRLLRPHLGRPETPPPTRVARDGDVARRARERLHDAVAEDIGADALAREAGAADRFHLARAFRAAHGAPPHAYLVQIRLLRARRLLAAGEPPAVAAAACGFADQSHLGRWFRRAYGLTPGAYRTLCRRTGVPDGAARTG